MTAKENDRLCIQWPSAINFRAPLVVKKRRNLEAILVSSSTHLRRKTVAIAESDRIIGEYFANVGESFRTFLIVKKQKEQVKESVSRINEFAGREVALGITSDNIEEYRLRMDLLAETPVLVITHERYDRLATHKDEFFYTITKNDGVRYTLVIDEAPPRRILSFNKGGEYRLRLKKYCGRGMPKQMGLNANLKSN